MVHTALTFFCIQQIAHYFVESDNVDLVGFVAKWFVFLKLDSVFWVRDVVGSFENDLFVR